MPNRNICTDGDRDGQGRTFFRERDKWGPDNVGELLNWEQQREVEKDLFQVG